MRPLRKDNRSPAVAASPLRLIQGGQAGLPAMFTCPNQPGNLRLSKSACAGLHKRALRADPYTDPQLAGCRVCETGAKHSGLKVAPARPKTCVRCQESTFRLTGKIICVGCFNRQREVIVGKNARGAFPKNFRPLHVYDYDDDLIVVGRDPAEAADVVGRMTGCCDPGVLVDYGQATPAEIGSWWEKVVKPWSVKRARAVRKEFKL